jgi:predicted ATPase
VSSSPDSIPSVLSPLVDAIVARKGAAAVITAPRAAGKSALLDLVERRAEGAGWATGRAAPARVDRYTPYAAVRPLFEPTPTLLDSPTAAIAETAHHLYRLCADRARATPLALFIDNAQWADRGSLRVLSQLARRTAELRLLVVLATRPREGSGHPDVSVIFGRIPGVHTVVGQTARR